MDFHRCTEEFLAETRFLAAKYLTIPVFQISLGVILASILSRQTHHVTCSSALWLGRCEENIVSTEVIDTTNNASVAHQSRTYPSGMDDIENYYGFHVSFYCPVYLETHKQYKV